MPRAMAITQMDEFLSSLRSEYRGRAVESLQCEIIFGSSLEENYG